MDYRWYVAQVLAGLEATAIYYLSRAGISGWSPSLAGVKLFPGYIFVELGDVESETGIVNRTRGVHKLLPIHARNALPIREPNFVEELREKISSGVFDERTIEEIVYKFVPQQEVRIKTGTFQDHHGRFLRYHKGSGIVLGYLLGRKIEIPVPLRELAPVQITKLGGARGALAELAA